jgi:protein gp37
MTKIEWTDETWNPVVGCSVDSPGCTNCYAMRLAGGRLRHLPKYAGLTEQSKAGPVWNGKVRFDEEALMAPFHWRKPRRVFVNSMGDLFHEDVPDEWIDRVFAVMSLSPQHTYQVLTKRAVRLEKLNPDLHWPRNVWMGVSVENADYAYRIQHLRRTDADVKFLSLEPLLGPLEVLNLADIDWVIVGGESGPDARPMHPDWARSIRDQCKEAGVPFFFKQWGAWAPWDDDNWSMPSGWDDSSFQPLPLLGDAEFVFVGKKIAGRLLDGREWNECPEAAGVPPAPHRNHPERG